MPESPTPPSVPRVDAINEKYRLEKEKRTAARQTALADLTGNLAHYLDDPYTPARSRVAVDELVDVVIVGTGIGGLVTAVRLIQAGVESIRLIDRAGGIGGVWYWNRYPGAQCDVESYTYLPLLEDMGFMPREKYSFQPELLGYLESIADKFDLVDRSLFHTSVDDAVWDDATSRWSIGTDRGDTIAARFLVVSTGALSATKMPAISGLETFRGHSFHTSRWDYTFTGDGTVGDLQGLKDKRVGVIGTGATAIQVVPSIADSVKQLVVFQRTPSSVGVRGNRPTDDEWASSLTPGWHERRRLNFLALTSGELVDEDLVDDGWTKHWGALAASAKSEGASDDEVARLRELVDLQIMEELRDRVDSIVGDSARAEQLKAYYRYLCKRPCFHDQYLDAFNRDNVDLVDASLTGIERITERGIVVDGHEHELDCIVFATGFEAGASFEQRFGFDIVGKEGQKLSQKWQDGIASLYGVTTSGFPNFLLNAGMVDAHTPVTVSITHTIDRVAAHVAYVVGEILRRGHAGFDTLPEAENEWTDLIVRSADRDTDFFESCTPGRANFEGRPLDRPAKNRAYPGPAREFFDLLEVWQNEDRLSGLELIGDVDRPGEVLLPSAYPQASSGIEASH